MLRRCAVNLIGGMALVCLDFLREDPWDFGDSCMLLAAKIVNEDILDVEFYEAEACMDR